jgi:phosphoglycerate dehydrogenase-like enzyme
MLLIILDDTDEREGYLTAVKARFPEVTVHAFSREEDIGGLIEEADILLTRKISDGLLQRAKKLQWIQVKTSGVNYIVDLPSYKKEVLLTSARGIHGPQVSEMAILLMLALNRNFPQNVRNQEKKIWDRWPGKLLYQKEVGILGIGVIGEEIAKKCKSFGMTVHGIDLAKKRIDSVDYFYGPSDLLQVMPKVDYFVIVVPYTRETEHMINRNVLSAMKPTSYLINLGRGKVVDEEALIEVLKKEKIAGAALDTFQAEPLPKDHPFWSLRNVIITPHVAGASDNYVEQVFSIFGENLSRFLKGEREGLINLVKG